jgi:hypothetical protein
MRLTPRLNGIWDPHSIIRNKCRAMERMPAEPQME